MWLSIVPLGISLFSRPQIKTKLSSVFSISFHPSPSLFSCYYLLVLSCAPLPSLLRFSLRVCSSKSPPFQNRCLKRKFPSRSVWIVRFEKKGLSRCPELPASAHLPPSYTPFLFSLSRLLLRAPHPFSPSVFLFSSAFLFLGHPLRPLSFPFALQLRILSPSPISSSLPTLPHPTPQIPQLLFTPSDLLVCFSSYHHHAPFSRPNG